ncbi:unnamed protein product (macronuclear) [Paramecium tetraurelia]|uniref:TNFR-Cys domain-containing protein n=1 Tax=Paramecium tetraurelia TaxID=5888 RepID=A0D6E1_PARTE|nr:uncharacterized protein GSPATT00001649001 [Paramecium tetraurelia]CAK78608.1 unnamed protein product [Paramecium tetraurelia]|eukprot:XP_001446005.1 hypothetical protein (macronuclear) [Paramecium tetraurelia strain d4-2]
MIQFFLLCCLKLQAFQQLILLSSSFDSNSFVDNHGWYITKGLSNNIYQDCGTNRIFGGISNFGNMTLISKFFTLPPHSIVQVKLDFWKLSNWANNETISVHLDGLKVVSQEVNLLPTGSNICGGNDYVLSIDQTILHNFETLQVIVTANIAMLGQIQVVFALMQGFWGIKNFRLFIQLCPAGCQLCQDTDSRFDCLQWTLYVSSLTETELQNFNYDGWNVENGEQQYLSECQMLPMICGPSLCGINSVVKYQQILPPHFKLKIRFRYYYIDSWDSEHSYLYVNDEMKLDLLLQFGSGLRNYSLCGQTRFNDLSEIGDVNLGHTQQLITFEFKNNLDQDFIDESFGIRDFRIYLCNKFKDDLDCQFGDSPSQQCSQFCGDKIVQQTEECDDGNSIPFDGCHNCQYNCVEGCSNCVKGICLYCYSEWNYQITTKNCLWMTSEQLVQACLNDIDCINQVEVWHQECSLNCIQCYQAICLECQEGYNLLAGECQEICGISAISMFQYPNCFCDQNCQLCNFGMCKQCIDTYTLADDKCLVICGDGLVTIGVEECDDKNDIPYDGCFQCIYQCQESCNTCEKGVCIDQCKNGMPKVNGQCQSYCGNQIVEENEQCDDNNSIQFDGCYLCEYSCPLYCSICEEGKCQECNLHFYYDNSTFSCQSVCGDGILTSETEQCDDSNTNPGDGCSSVCMIEQDWICIQNEECIYYKYPELLTNYVSQKNQYQYVQIEFTQQLKRLSDTQVDYFNFISATIISMDQSKYNISIIPKSNASATLSWVIYAVEIYIDQELNDPPFLNISLLEPLYNEYDIKLINQISILQIKIPNYLSKEDIEISQNLLAYSEKSIYSLGALAGFLLISGNGLAFWTALEILQEQSYFKYLNIIYPQNLMIYFEASEIISLRTLYNSFNYQELPSFYKFRYFESNEKFGFYQVNANIAENIKSLVFSFVVLIIVYIMSYKAEKCLTILQKKRYCEDNAFLSSLYNKLKFRAFKNKYSIRKYGLNKLFSASCWDIFFMVFLQLSVKQFNHLVVNQMIALTTLFASLIYITSFFTGKTLFQNPQQYWRDKLQLCLNLKKCFIMYSLVIYQSNYVLQFILICIPNSLYLLSWIYLKTFINTFEYYQTLILQSTLLIFLLTTPIYWDLDIFNFQYSTKLIVGWFHIIIFLFVIVFFLIADTILSLKQVLNFINRSLQTQCNQEKEEKEQQKTELQSRPIKFIACLLI